MPLQTSGAISLNEIHVEAGGSSATQASLNDSDIRALIGKSSGAQNSFNEYYGASASQPFTLTISSNSKRYVVYSQAFAAGWDGVGALTVNINSGVYVWSDDPDDYALIISGSYPGGVRVNNYGYIMGRGGDDPNLDKYNPGSLSYDYQNKDGGHAIYISASGVTIDNKSSGYILGGGGAGSWASTSSVINSSSTSGGGGAGGGYGGNWPFVGPSPGGSLGQNGSAGSIEANAFPSNRYTAPTIGGGGGAGGGYTEDASNSNYTHVGGSQGGGRKVPTGDVGGRSGRILFNTTQFEYGQGGAAGVDGGYGVIAGGNNTQFSGGGGGGYGARGGQGYSYPAGGIFISDYGAAGKAIDKNISYTLTGSTNRIYGAT